MSPDRAPEPATPSKGASAFRFGRLIPLAVLGAVMALVFATGLHHQLSLETLVRHRASLGAFVSAHQLSALAAFVGLYVVVVALSIPGAALLTVAGGFLFGVVIAGTAVVVGATVGATLVFLIARGAIGDFLVRRAGLRMARIGEGFRADAFNYLLFLRLVPVFPFWLVNLAPAIFGVGLGPFVAATALGIIPGTFAFAYVGQGLDSVIAAHGAAYDACVAAGGANCHIGFDLRAAVTSDLILAFVALGIAALIPVILKWFRARRNGPQEMV